MTCAAASGLSPCPVPETACACRNWFRQSQSANEHKVLTTTCEPPAAQAAQTALAAGELGIALYWFWLVETWEPIGLPPQLTEYTAAGGAALVPVRTQALSATIELLSSWQPMHTTRSIGSAAS